MTDCEAAIYLLSLKLAIEQHYDPDDIEGKTTVEALSIAIAALEQLSISKGGYGT